MIANKIYQYKQSQMPFKSNACSYGKVKGYTKYSIKYYEITISAEILLNTGKNPDDLMNDKELHNWVEKLSLPVLYGGSAVRVKRKNSNLFSISSWVIW